jgi:hypothetical protein
MGIPPSPQRPDGPKRNSFDGGRGAKRASFGEEGTPRNRTSSKDASPRGSAGGGGGSAKEELSEAQKEKMEEEKKKRRASAMERFSMGSGISIDDEMADMISGVKADMTPIEKLERLMIAAKESGMDVKTLFMYFDKDGDEEITHDEFKEALTALDKSRNVLRVTEEDVAAIIAE